MTKRQKNGFTLVELLAIIVILSIVSGIVISIFVNVIKNAEEKGYLNTINNVEQAAVNYVLEYKDNILWKDLFNNNSYQCVLVQKLVDVGYFKGDVVNSLVAKNDYLKLDDSVYIEIDNTTKKIVKSELIYNNDSSFLQFCNGN